MSLSVYFVDGPAAGVTWEIPEDVPPLELRTWGADPRFLIHYTTEPDREPEARFVAYRPGPRGNFHPPNTIPYHHHIPKETTDGTTETPPAPEWRRGDDRAAPPPGEPRSLLPEEG